MRRWVAGHDVYDVATAAVFIALTAIALLTLRSYAISNDEPVQHRYGELILDYYRSGLLDRAVFAFKDLYLYGGLFDILAVSLGKVIPIDAYELRHVLCLLFGLGGIAAVAATARQVGTPRAALFAVITLATCGAWYGAMFNHTKDIPLAAAMAGATLMLIRCARQFPTPRRRDVVAFGLMTGVALGIRVFGLLIPVYVGFALVLYGPRPWRPISREHIRFAVRSAAALLPALVIAYLIMIAAWPWAAQAPLNPVRALFAFSDYHYTIRTLLDGKIYDMASVPRYYVPLYFVIRVPLATLCGAALAVMLAFRPRGDASEPHLSGADVGLIALTALFPIACEVIAHGPADTGLRHFLYVLAPLSVLAGLGLDATLATLTRRQWQLGAAAAAVMAGLYVWYGSILVRLHPYEYVYYNSVVGGAAGAARRYDMDYWVNSMPEMVAELEDYLHRTEPIDAGRPPRVYTVAVCGERLSFDKSVTLPQLRWIEMENWEKADFFIAPTQMFCDRILGGKVVGTVERMGVPLAYVKDRRALTRPAVAAATH
ncbi:MAG: hypothetical protein P4M07_12660 [Xanthobacteraceae bacterium]|nr:hypothetical protein [Xanthobacteraceae bacterium]